jgi:hypothetical protein
MLQQDPAECTHSSYSYHQEQCRKFCGLMGRPARLDAHTVAQFVMGWAHHEYALSTIDSILRQGVYAVQQ